MIAPADFFDLSRPEVRDLFASVTVVWDVVARLPTLTADLIGGRRVIRGEVMPGAVVDDGPVHIGPGARLEPGSYVKGPAYIGPGVTLRHGAYVREHCVLLAGSVVGHASEVKQSLFLPSAKAPHFAYVGDSVLGHRVNLGAGTKLSNLAIVPVGRPDDGPGTVVVPVDGRPVDTRLRKLGAVLGDDVQVGCNAVLNPGTLIGPGSVVYPGASLRRGYYPAGVVIKVHQTLDMDVLRR